MSHSYKTSSANVQTSLETIYTELNQMGYDLIDYTHALGEAYNPDIDVWETRPFSQAVKSVKQDLPTDMQQIIEGFKRLGGLSIDLISPYGDIDFAFTGTGNEPQSTQEIINRYNKLTGETTDNDCRSEQAAKTFTMDIPVSISLRGNQAIIKVNITKLRHLINQTG